MIELKPCPICNGVVVLYTFSPTKTYHFKYIRCSECKMLFTKRKWRKMDAKEVIEDWGVKE